VSDVTRSSEPILAWVWRYLSPYRRRVAALAALSSLEVLLRILSPWPMKVVVDSVLGSAPLSPLVAALVAPSDLLEPLVANRRERMLAGVVAAGLAIQILHQLVLMVHSRIAIATGQRMVRDLREQVFAHLQAVTLLQHGRLPAADLIYRLESDAACLEHLVMRGLFPIVFSALTLIAMGVVLAGIDRRLALVSMAVAPALFLALRRHGREIRPIAMRAKELESALMQRLHESMTAIRLVKSYAREDLESGRFAAAAECALAARLSSARQETRFSATVSSLSIGGTSLVLLVGGVSVLDGRLSLGTLLLLIAYLGFVYGPLCGIANTTSALQQAVASARRIRDTLALQPEPVDPPGAIDAGTIARGDVVFDGVSFGYGQGAEAIRGLSFTAKAGELVALVGPSGSGKTTAVSLITRLYEPSAGRILIDGVDIRRYGLRSLRRRIAVVLQDAVVLSGTVRHNLRYGRLEASDAEVEAAARAADAHTFVSRLPQAYDTHVGEGGHGLSGGQKQRLSIARAFLKDAPILILDEPTAALDTISEASILASLRRLRAGRTTFVIAHRLSTVQAADRILVLDRGRVVAEGRHDTLMRESRLYARLARQLQAPPPAPLDGLQEAS
jgi:ATP-binding cassette subfamily B protein/subfamily B ATP-binding cassette protein MsbA